MVSTTLCKIPTALPVFFHICIISIFYRFINLQPYLRFFQIKNIPAASSTTPTALPPSSSKKIFSPINFIEISISISYTLINSRFLFLLLLVLLQHVRRHLVYIVIQPVRVQRVGHISPFQHRHGKWIVVRVIVARYLRI